MPSYGVQTTPCLSLHLYPPPSTGVNFQYPRVTLSSLSHSVVPSWDCGRRSGHLCSQALFYSSSRAPLWLLGSSDQSPRFKGRSRDSSREAAPVSTLAPFISWLFLFWYRGLNLVFTKQALYQLATPCSSAAFLTPRVQLGVHPPPGLGFWAGAM